MPIISTFPTGSGGSGGGGGIPLAWTIFTPSINGQNNLDTFTMVRFITKDFINLLHI